MICEEIEDVREADFRLAKPLYAALWKSSIWRIQLVSGFHLATNLGHHLQVVDSKRLKSPTHTVDRTAVDFVVWRLSYVRQYSGLLNRCLLSVVPDAAASITVNAALPRARRITDMGRLQAVDRGCACSTNSRNIYACCRSGVFGASNGLRSRVSVGPIPVICTSAWLGAPLRASDGPAPRSDLLPSGRRLNV